MKRVELRRLREVLWPRRATEMSRDQLAALVRMRESVFGPEHPQTLTARHNLAYSTGMAGDAAAARDQFAALLAVRERVLGPAHPDTQKTRSNLARWSDRRADESGELWVGAAGTLPEHGSRPTGSR